MVATNAKLSPEVRAAETAKTLGLENLSDTQKIALEKAHNTGESGAGNWTQAELKLKIETLRDGGFDQAQTRMILEHGYAGRGDIKKLGGQIADTVESIWEAIKNPFKTVVDGDSK